MSAHDPFSKGVSERSAARGQSVGTAASEVGRSDDLLIECGDGDEETISYHLYLGTSLRKQATQLIVRFATRIVIVDGERLAGVRDRIAARRCARLRASDRTELMRAGGGKGPIVGRIRVLTPKTGEDVLAEEREE